MVGQEVAFVRFVVEDMSSGAEASIVINVDLEVADLPHMFSNPGDEQGEREEDLIGCSAAKAVAKVNVSLDADSDDLLGLPFGAHPH